MPVIIPKVFISYSWAVGDKVKELAERLVANGVDVVLDKWDLKEGQDKYAFMEQAVNNPEITRVLIICDKTYSEKANNRTGGVGDETVIISPEIYGNVAQEKFVPVVFEKDENGNPHLPAYIKSRIYFDLSNEDIYEVEYEKLLRNIFGKPEYKKPKLGKAPEWLNDEDVSFSAIRDVIKQIKGYSGNNSSKADFLTRKAIEEFTQALTSLGFPLDKPIEPDLYLKRIEASKPLRDYFVDYVEALISKDISVGDILSNYFEELHNNVSNTHGLSQYYSDNFEFYYFFIWESFICTISALLYYEKYADINKIIARTYFLKKKNCSSNEEASTFIEFYQNFRIIENVCKPQSDNPRLYTLAGEIIVGREKRPFITKESIVNADLILYQVSSAIFDTKDWKWFPALYVYSDWSPQRIWVRLRSKRYCEKLYPLFGVDSILKLKEKIANCIYDNKYRHRNAYDAAPNILASIKLEEIGSLE